MSISSLGMSGHDRGRRQAFPARGARALSRRRSAGTRRQRSGRSPPRPQRRQRGRPGQPRGEKGESPAGRRGVSPPLSPFGALLLHAGARRGAAASPDAHCAAQGGRRSAGAGLWRLAGRWRRRGGGAAFIHFYVLFWLWLWPRFLLLSPRRLTGGGDDVEGVDGDGASRAHLPLVLLLLSHCRGVCAGGYG